MKYFSPSYWFKLWVLSAPLFSDKTQGINAMSVDNKKIKNWASKDITSLESINESSNLTNSIVNYQPYNLNQTTNQNINSIYQAELEASTHKHRHEKHKSRFKKALSEKTSDLIFKMNQRNNVEKNTNLIINYLFENRIINRITTQSSESVYEINRNLEGNTSRYFLIPIRTENNKNDWKLELLFTAHDLYLNGFILRKGNTVHYFYFNEANIQNINNANNHVLGFGGDYGALNRADGTGRAPQQNINRDSIIQSIDYLNDFITNNVFNLNNNRFFSDNRQTRQSLRNIILLISESIRFSNISNDLNNLYNGEVNNYNWNHFEDTILNWQLRSRNALLPSITAQTLANDVRILNLQTAIERHNIQEISRRTGFYPTNCTPNWMARQKRQINNNFICSNEFYYDNKNKILSTRYGNKNTDFHVVTLNLGKNNPLNFDKISVLNEQDTYTKISWGNDDYWGTKFSDFLKNKKISDLLVNEKINENKKEDFFNTHHCFKLQDINKSSTFAGMSAIQSIYPTFYWENDNYYLQFFIHQYGETWTSFSGGELWMNIGNGIKFDKYIDIDSTSIETQISAPKSCKARFYYDNNKNSKTFKLAYDNTHNNIVTLNLGKNNPLNFDKISVLNEEYPYVKASWGNNAYPGTKFSDFLKDKKISDLLVNEKITENNKEAFLKNHNFHKLQEKKETVFLGSIAVIQSIYPTFYWENNNYYLQLFIHQYGETWKSSGGELWMNIGNGIILQNENCGESRKKRNIKSNENKWTNKFTKDINHEQHLSITNNTNYALNNITSL